MDSHFFPQLSRGTRAGAFVLTLIASAVTLGATQPADAAPKKDSCQVKANGSGTIQDAIDSGCTTIRVFPGTYTENLFIESGTVTIDAVSNGSNTIIDGGGDGSVVTVDSGAQVTLDGLILQNGSFVLGGGIYNKGNVSLINTTVSNNFAAYAGGGIFNDGTLGAGTLTLSNSLITNNIAGENGDVFQNELGGGIFNNQGTVTLNDSSVTNNQAVFQGGGIFNSKGTLNLTDSLVTGNVAGFNGGGIANLQGELNIAPSTVVEGNTPDDIAGD